MSIETEPITIWRAPSTTGAYGEVVHDDPVPWVTINALAAPVNPEESSEVGRQAVITGYTVYHRTSTPTGILATDLVEVRSPVPGGTVQERRLHLLPVDGMPADWRRGSRVIGEQFAVKVVTG